MLSVFIAWAWKENASLFELIDLSYNLRTQQEWFHFIISVILMQLKSDNWKKDQMHLEWV
jgi:hypothetical protein